MTELTKRYDLVETSVMQFHQKCPNGAIETSVTINGKVNYFMAKVTPDVETPARIFTWFCFGDAIKERAMEEMELEAISRALATAGISNDIPIGLPFNEDAGDALKTTPAEPSAKTPGNLATEKQINLILKKCAGLQISPEARKAYLWSAFWTETISGLTRHQASQFIMILNEPREVAAIKATVH